ncbi:MAG: BMP family ABC transporter substrate-binding protein [Candidatus Obscuribacterales bacterium]|nr:BMP family ABC transporter substrate-binding protein [Candidatus Obscuribacterales bacterium]
MFKLRKNQLLASATLFFALCINTASAAEPLKVGFITVGPINDWGYNYAHNQGRLYLDKTMAGKVQTTIAENIPESAEVERVMEKMIAQGNKVIFSTSYGYYEPELRVAKRHRDVTFLQCGRDDLQNTPNLATYFAKQYEPMYVSGVVAGRMTKKNSLGFIAAHPVPQVLQNINAFALGARSVNPKVKVKVVWTNKWSDATIEAEAAKGLIESGADVLTLHLDSPITVVQTAEKNGVYAVGYHADVSKFAPKGWLTGAMWNWGPLYVQTVKSIQDKTWKPGNYRYPMKDGFVKLAPFGSSVTKKVQDEALSVKKKIESGEFVIFAGPLKDRDGKELLKAGQKADFNFLESMSWFVPGVEGTLPKK